MAMTLKELAVNVLEYLDEDHSDSDLVGDSATIYANAFQWVNWAMQDFADIGPWPWLTTNFQTFTVAEDGYATDLPVTFRQMLANPSYEDSQYGALKPVTMDEIHGLRAYSTSSGTPEVWSLGFNQTTARNTLVVHPPASASTTLKISYAVELTYMSAGTTYLPVPDRYGRIVQIGAIAYAEEHNQRNWNSGARPAFEQQAREAFRKWGRQQSFVPRPMHQHNHRRDRRGLPEVLERDLEATHPAQ